MNRRVCTWAIDLGPYDSAPTHPGRVHSWTPVGADLRVAWRAYADIAMGGGDPPLWTGSADPQTAVPPLDAAGVLWRAGDTPAVPRTIAEAASALLGVVAADDPMAWQVDAVSAYFSSGGRGVFLLRALLRDDPDPVRHHYVVVGRMERRPRIGASERNYRAGAESVLFPEGGAR